jgi:hypothetical protein
VQGVNPEPVTVTFVAAYLLELDRDHQMWKWTRATPLPSVRRWGSYARG